MNRDRELVIPLPPGMVCTVNLGSARDMPLVAPRPAVNATGEEVRELLAGLCGWYKRYGMQITITGDDVIVALDE